MAEWSKAADCKSVRKLALVRIQFFSFIYSFKLNKRIKYKTFYKNLYFDKKESNYEIHSFRSLSITNLLLNKQTTKKLISASLYSINTIKYTFIDRGYNVHKNTSHSPHKTLALNFTRNKFFPVIRSLKGETYFFLSLGLLAKFLLKGKSFTKSKTVFLLLASFLRKILLFSSFRYMYLFINKTPLYFKEIMSIINDPVVNIYKNPFGNSIITEKEIYNPFSFPVIIFSNNKAYGKIKNKKKGRLKRKITKRLVSLNRVLD